MNTFHFRELLEAPSDGQRAQGNFGTGQRGFTLLELMIAMLLGLLVLIGVTTLVMNTGKANREQAALARMQENGRFALSRIAADLRMAGSQYCSSFSNDPGSPDVGYPLRALWIRAADPLPFGLPGRTQLTAAGIPLAPAGQPWALSPRYFIQGHECTTISNCSPVLAAATTLGAALPVPPVAGSAANQRPLLGADVLTVRYLGGPGIPIATAHTAGATPLQLAGTSNGVTLAGSMPWAAGELAMVADCANAEVFNVNGGGSAIQPAGNAGMDQLLAYPSMLDADGDTRVFNLNRDFRTVTYFLRLRANQDGGANISTLVRQENGQLQAIADGVERLEFLYGVRVNTPAGAPQLHFLNATQVQNGLSAGGTPLGCSKRPVKVRANEPGCLWRQVESIDVALLVNTVTNVAATDTELFSFSAAIPPLVNSVPPATLPSGLPRGRMFRKEFRTRVNVRAFTE